MMPQGASLTAEARLHILGEHYRETFGHLRDYIRSRNRLFVYALVAVVAMAFRASNAAQSETVLKLVIDKALAGSAGVDRASLAILLWFVLFAVVARYFQAVVTVNRQYDYVRRVEEEMAALYGNDVLSRESAAYLRDYPKFSDWMDLVYTWVFPIVLLLVVIWNLTTEFRAQGICEATISIAALAVATTITVCIYTYSAKFERQRTVTPALEPEA